MGVYQRPASPFRVNRIGGATADHPARNTISLCFSDTYEEIACLGPLPGVLVLTLN
jgi:hypothetical protein